VRREHWTLVAIAAGVALACQESITAPGACPEFCPQGSITILDTLLPNSVELLGSFDGYRLPYETNEMQVVGPGGPVQSHALLVFNRFSTAYTGGDTTVRNTVLQIDSLRFVFNVLRRNRGTSPVVLALHEIPIATDTSATYASTTAYFEDSTLLGTVTVPDSLVSGQIAVTVPTSAFRDFVGDSLRAGVGLRIASSGPAFVSVGTKDTVQSAEVLRFVRLDSIVDTSSVRKIVTRSDTSLLSFHTFVVDTANIPPAQGLSMGGVGAARAYVKLNVDSAFLDTTVIVRATLLLPPITPTFGAPGDTFQLQAVALGTDFDTFGPKSPLIVQSSDSTRISAVPVGSSQSVGIDVTDILRTWKSSKTLPHNIMLRVLPEAASIDRLDVADGTVGGAILRVTYGLPFRVPGR
jgi:hypothetical protein